MNLRVLDSKERPKVYQRLAGEHIAEPVKVYYFESDTVDFLQSGTVEGRAHKNDIGFLIGLRSGLGSGELAVFAHELAHVIHGDVVKKTQAEYEAGDILTAQILTGKGETTQAEQKAYMDREAQRDNLAERLIAEWSQRGIEW